MVNVYFGLTEEFNAEGVVALAGRATSSSEDRRRMRRYEEAARRYLAEFRGALDGIASLEKGHAAAVRLAERLLPERLGGKS